jgi:long-chain acyl-CoA synthetase
MRPHLASLVEEFRAHAAETAVVSYRGVRRYPTTYGELANLAGRFSAELDRRNIAPGDRVVLWGDNSAEWIAVFFGCLLRGVLAVPLDAAGTPDFAARVIRDTAPRLIVADSELLASLHMQEPGYPDASASGLTTSAADLGASAPGAISQPDQLPLATIADSELLTSLRAQEPRYPDASASGLTTSAANPGASAPGAISQPDHLPLPTIAAHLPPDPLFAVDPTVTEQTPFQIVFTSGTTSEPRGIVHTHRNVLVTLQPIENEIAKYRRYERLIHPLRFLHSLPLSHVFGQFMGLWIPALLAAEVHFAAQHEPARITALIRRERISVLIAVPRVLHLLRAHLLSRFPTLASRLESAGAPSLAVLSPIGAPASFAGGVKRVGSTKSSPTAGILSILKRWWRFRRVHRALGWKFWAVISGGATLPADLEAFWNRLGFALIQGYGMTETAALVTLNHPFHIAPGTIGKPLPGREVRITPEGEILVRGDMLSTATWSAGRMHQREGEWLATGDLAEKNAAGDLRFLGRKGDVIVTSAGLNIHPADLESALAAQPGIRTAVVVACDLPTGTEPVAVVLTSSPDEDLQAAVAAANRTLADYQQIRRVLRWPELQFPYTSTGKLIRRQVADWACATLTGSRTASTAAPTQDALLTLIAEVTGEPVAGNSATSDPNSLRLSEDLHLDSLGRVQLQSALEQRFSIELDDDALATISTLADLRTLLNQHLAPPSPTLSFRTLSEVEPGEESASGTSDDAGAPHLASEIWESRHQLPTPAPAPQLRTDNRELTTHTYPDWPWTWPIRILRIAFLELILRPLVWLLAAPRITYEAPITPGAPSFAASSRRVGSTNTHPPESTQPTTSNLQPPLLLIANHVTAYDGALILYAFPGHLRRRVAAAMSAEMLLDYRRARNQPNALANLLAPAAYFLLTALFNVFPLPRARGFRRSFAHAGEAMDRGYSVLIFPEGSRSRDGCLHPFRPGIGLLAQESRVPILPIAILGLHELRASRSRWVRSGRIEVRIGAPIPAADDLTDPAALTATLEQAIRRLLQGS